MWKIIYCISSVHCSLASRLMIIRCPLLTYGSSHVWRSFKKVICGSSDLFALANSVFYWDQDVVGPAFLLYLPTLYPVTIRNLSRFVSIIIHDQWPSFHRSVPPHTSLLENSFIVNVAIPPSFTKFCTEIKLVDTVQHPNWSYLFVISRTIALGILSSQAVLNSDKHVTSTSHAFICRISLCSLVSTSMSFMYCNFFGRCAFIVLFIEISL